MPEQFFTSDEKLESAAWSFKKWVAEKKAPPDIEHYCLSCGVRGLQMAEARTAVLAMLRQATPAAKQLTDVELLTALLKTMRETRQPVLQILLADEGHPPNAILQWLPDRRLYEAMLPLGNWIRHKKLHVCVGCFAQGREATIALQDAWRKERECSTSKQK